MRALATDSISRDRGSALLLAALVAIFLFSFTAAIVSLSTVEAKAQQEGRDRLQAFYLAEAGLEAAKYEITEELDADGDGLGNKTVEYYDGTYAVTAQSLSVGVWELVSQGTAGARNATLQVVIRRQTTSAFPMGAISFIGSVDSNNIIFNETAPDIIISGGDSPAIIVSEANTLESFAEKFGPPVANGSILPEDLTGGVMSTFEVGPDGQTYPVDLPFELDPQVPENLKDMSDLYTVLSDRAQALILTSTVMEDPGTASVSYGTSDAPVTLYANSSILLQEGQTLSGYGTLIVHEFDVKKGAAVNWTGNVIVVPSTDETNDKPGWVAVSDPDTQFNVTGNLVVLGNDTEGTQFRADTGGNVSVTGSMVIASSHSATASSNAAKLELGNDASLSLNGLLTMIGPRAQTNLKSGSEFSVTGALQVATPQGSSTDVRLEFGGSVEIYKDDAGITIGAEALEDLGVTLNLSEILISKIVTGGVLTSTAWHPIYQ